MPKLSEIINQPEGRKLEFKSELPTKSDLAKTIVAFANDAGGELYLGIQDTPREVIGLNEDELISIEEQISNIIHDQCSPVIYPVSSFLVYEGKHIIRVTIYPGSNPPYFLSAKGIEKGTYIRVGSSNRLATPEIIETLKLRNQNISFDSQLMHQTDFDTLNIDSLKALFLEKTGEEITPTTLRKLNLTKIDQSREVPTIALVLLSDDELRKEIFSFAKIECARFKGTVPGNFIDQKTITEHIGIQAELAYQFVLRHISESSTDYQGVFRNDRWEYPVIAIREALRNAVIHRDYSLRGKDIKVAIFDDKIEITSPGNLLPTVDFNDMTSGQSDIRNMILAPVFKKLGIIEQWGNGLRLMADELAKYPEIGLEWNEPGASFRVSFVKKTYNPQQESQQESQQEMQQEIQQELQQELQQESLFSKILFIVEVGPQSRKSISLSLGQKVISGQLNEIINKLKSFNLIEWTIANKPQSSKQRFKITQQGLAFLKLLKKSSE